ncbi:MAG: response regulator [Caldilineaceae bacterium]|nr:response regulator [Caldilineaceae bacterium]
MMVAITNECETLAVVMPPTTSVQAVAPRLPTQEKTVAHPTILLVDDSEIIRTLVEQLLSSADYNVLTAEHGMAALAILETTAVDLVLLDVMMPVMDGLRTCTEIRKRCATPVVFLSSVKDTTVARYVHQLGANAYLPKASKPQEILACLQTLLAEPTTAVHTKDAPSFMR